MAKIAMAIFVCLLICPLQADENSSDSYARFNRTKVGDKTPVTEVTTLSGEKLSFTGKVVVINFFATWCPPCRTELPEIQRLWKKYRNHPKVVIISISRGERAKVVTAFRTTRKLQHPMVLDPKKELYLKFASGYIPRNYMIDQQGKIIFQAVGYDKKEFAEMEQLLAKEVEAASEKKRESAKTQ